MGFVVTVNGPLQVQESAQEILDRLHDAAERINDSKMSLLELHKEFDEGKTFYVALEQIVMFHD